ncbi:MAG: nucleoside triphosphate pyrophosphohydrolase [Bacteroidales bacterium]|jgi:XTP/dITP diphosphohydrolase|nr:nucleoside triphosphate pyrophosphohydrolase [Bacteroidales bacterium]
MTQDPRLLAFKELLDIMDRLRMNCPWDKAQTFESLRYLTIEETYELSDAILDKKYGDISKELGDLMLHLVFYAKIGSEQSLFDITDVLKEINEKLIRRHPHIFADTKVENADDVRANWEVIKLKEGNKSVLGGVPVSLPAMVKAYRIQEKASGVGFDWNDSDPAWEKVQEELQEFKDELAQKSDRMEDEFGDLLFALVNYARLTKINPEDALEKTNKRFIKRFQFMENRAKEIDKPLSDMSLDEMDKLWQEAKSSGI